MWALEWEGKVVVVDAGLELLLREALQPRVARFPWSKRDAPRHLPVEPQAVVGRRRADGDIAGGGHHPAANIEAHRAHGHGTGVSIGQENRADGHAVAVVDVGRDRHQFDAGKAGRVHDLRIDGLFDLVQQVGREEQSHRDGADLLRMQRVVALPRILGR